MEKKRNKKGKKGKVSRKHKKEGKNKHKCKSNYKKCKWIKFTC